MRLFVFTLSLLAAAGPAVVQAQGGAWPTLSDAGLEYLSRSGFLQVTLSGQLDLEALHVGRGRWGGLVGGEAADSVPADWRAQCAACHTDSMVVARGKGGTMIAPRLRLFADVFLGDRVYVLVEGRVDRGHAPSRGRFRGRVEQAYVRVSVAGSAGVQVGRFASPFGSYAARHLTPADPFLRPPLAYDYRTVMNRSHAPPDADGFLTWRNWPELFRLPGAPPVWDVPYQWGTMLFASVGRVDLRAAAMGGAPSSKPDAWDISGDRLEHPSWVAGVRVRASPSLEIGASYNRGPWLEEIAEGSLPGGPSTRWDFHQEMISTDLSFARGGWNVRGEVLVDRWDVPNVAERPTDVAYGVEAMVDVAAGWSVGARVGFLDFRPLGGGSAGPLEWDRDVVRLEGSLGYRLARNAGVMLSGYGQEADGEGSTVLIGLRAWWAF